MLLLFLALFQSSHLLRVPDGVSEELVLLGPPGLVGGALGQLGLVLPDPALLLRGGRGARPPTGRRTWPLRKDVGSIAVYTTGMVVANAILQTTLQSVTNAKLTQLRFLLWIGRNQEKP